MAAGGDGVTGSGVNGLGDDGVEQIEIRGAGGQRFRTTAGAVVVDISTTRASSTRRVRTFFTAALSGRAAASSRLSAAVSASSPSIALIASVTP